MKIITERKDMLIVVLVTLLVAALLILLSTSLRQELPFTKDILSITKPVHDLDMVVEKVEGEALVVSTKDLDKKISYRVMITDKTELFRLPEESLNFFYFARTETHLINPSLKEVVPGMNIKVSTASDLRKVINNSFEATKIALTPVPHVFLGEVKNVDGSRITVSVNGPIIPASYEQREVQAKEKLYTFTITDTTDYYQAEALAKQPSREKSVKLTVNDQVAVMTNENINGKDPLTAAIILVQPKILPTPQVMVNPSSTNPY